MTIADRIRRLELLAEEFKRERDAEDAKSAAATIVAMSAIHERNAWLAERSLHRVEQDILKLKDLLR